jgi:ABC-type transporter Mla MlaB component
MLRITITDNELEQRWILQGRLAGPWVTELESNWKNRRVKDQRKCVVDLTDVTVVDKCGEQLLEEMQRAGAELTGSGVYLNYLVDEITSRCRRFRRSA